ncbi:glycoside hydrolase family 7 protein [Serendipita vermifera]|nr:glycoside hydrolase family 7 protein [Serendipita vermifera]
MKLSAAFASLLSVVTLATAQQVGTQKAETHPSLSWSKCTSSGCTQQSGSITLDANWRWLHTTSGYTNCYTGNEWDTSLCPDGATCAANCALDGADYSGTYGITTSGNALTLKFVTGANVGSRVYLMASESAYEMFKLKNQEFTFDVDVSNLGCGLNGAVYFSEMEADGGLSKYSSNKAGAKYGTGYCDSQCPHDIKFINGEANVEGWAPSENDSNAGKGKYGSCCNEMDIWEANKISAAYTPHGCTVEGQYRCEGDECGDGDNRYGGVCDKDGCDFNSYRMGDTSFYGPGGTGVDTGSKFTIVTQFITDDGTANGALTEIRRLYVQNGQVVQNSKTAIAGMDEYDSITVDFCAAQKTAFGDTNDFAAKGAFTPMDKALTNGMVLVLSIWDDHEVNMLWLDSTYPTDSTSPGAARGTCPTDSGKPEDVESQQASASVTYSNIRVGDLDTTYTGGSSGTPSTTDGGSGPTTTSTAAGSGQTLYGQCVTIDGIHYVA